MCILTCFLFFTLFQIRAEPKSCLTLHHVYGSQGANRTARINTQTCIDRTHSPKTAVYQVGNKTRKMHVWKKKSIHQYLHVDRFRHFSHELESNKTMATEKKSSSVHEKRYRIILKLGNC